MENRYGSVKRVFLVYEGSSREDIQVTARLTEAGKLIGITVLDHIIHGDGTGEVVSLRECAK